MAKRFTDTNKYRKPFIRGLKGAYKLLWDYLYHDCDHAGIWIVDFEVAQIYIGYDMKVNERDALKFFNDGEVRIIPFDCNSKWFIPGFVDFQYGELNPSNRAHNSVINILYKQNLYNEDKGLIRVLQDPMDKDKDKDMDKDKKSLSIKTFNFKQSLLDIEIEEHIVSDWLKVRSKKKATNTQTAFNGLLSQIKKSGLSANECIKIAVENSWSGFKAEWLEKESTNKSSIQVNVEKHYEEWK